MPFFASLVICFPAIRGFSACVYDEFHCTNKIYFESRVKIYLGKKVMKLRLNYFFFQDEWPNFEQFPIVRFEWDLLHRLILGWNLWRLHFFLEIPHPSSEFPPPLFPKTFPPNFEHFFIVRFWPPSPPLPFPKSIHPNLNNFLLSNFDWTCYMELFFNAICDIFSFFLQISTLCSHPSPLGF